MAQVAQIFQVNPETVRREIKEGKLRALTIRGAIRIRRRSLSEYIDAHTPEAPADAVVKEDFDD